MNTGDGMYFDNALNIEDPQLLKEQQKRQKRIRTMINALDLIDKSLNEVSKRVDQLNLDMRIAVDYTNPQKEEIVKELSTLPELINYFGHMKVQATMYSDWFQYKLSIAEQQARREVRKEYAEEVRKFTETINQMFSDAIKSASGNEKALVATMKVIQDHIKTSKPKEPSDKEYEILIKEKIQGPQKLAMEWKAKANIFKETHSALQRKHDSVRSLKSLVEMDETPLGGQR